MRRQRSYIPGRFFCTRSRNQSKIWISSFSAPRLAASSRFRESLQHSYALSSLSRVLPRMGLPCSSKMGRYRPSTLTSQRSANFLYRGRARGPRVPATDLLLLPAFVELGVHEEVTRG